MIKSPGYVRISLTLPPDVLAAADRLAAALDRSRSWVIADLIRRGTVRGEDPGPPEPGAGHPESIEQVVHASEASAVRAGALPRPGAPSVQAFQTIEGWLAWRAKARMP